MTIYGLRKLDLKDNDKKCCFSYTLKNSIQQLKELSLTVKHYKKLNYIKETNII